MEKMITDDPPVTDAMEIYLGTEVTLGEKCKDMNAYYIEEDAEGWGFPVEAFILDKTYRCIKGFSIEKCDDDGFTLENEYMVVEECSIWHIPDEDNYRFIGGEIRLESDDLEWLEISKDTLKERFVLIR